jgi:hypothetical protein
MIAWLKGDIHGCPPGLFTGNSQGMYLRMRCSGLFVIAAPHHSAILDNDRANAGVRRSASAPLSGLGQCQAHKCAVLFSRHAIDMVTSGQIKNHQKGD